MASEPTHAQDVIDYDVDRRKRFAGLKPDDIARVLAIKDAVAGHVDEHAPEPVVGNRGQQIGPQP